MKKIINQFLKIFGYQVSKYQSKEKKIFETQKQVSKSENRKVIFDVGAYDGEISIKYNNLFAGNCDIYSFEPYKVSFDLLEKNTTSFDNIKSFNIAIGSKDETRDFYINKFAPTNSFLESSAEGIEVWGNEILVNKEKIQVPSLTIDSFVEEHQIEQIDILKLDTQGAEYLVLEGAKKTIAEGKIKMIFSELIVMPTYTNQKDLDEMLKLFKEYGFELFTLFNSVDIESQRLKFLDGIFIYKNQNQTKA